MLLSRKLTKCGQASEYLLRYRHNDIVISGGGVVGLTMLTALVNNPSFKGRKITLLERGSDKNQYDLNNPPLIYQNPVYAITPSSKRLFEKLNMWSLIQNSRVKKVKKMQIWESTSESNLIFESNLEENVMYIIEQELLLSALKERLSTLLNSNFQIMYQAEVSHYKMPSDHQPKTPPLLHSKLDHSEKRDDKLSIPPPVDITLKSGETLTTSLLIGSDGFNSNVRKTMDPSCFQWDYHQSSIIATLVLGDECENTVAWQKFTPQGVIALLPLNSQQSSLVWSTDTANANKLTQCSDEIFVDHLNRALWDTTTEDSKLVKMESVVDKVMDFLPFENFKVRRRNTFRQLPPRITGIQDGSRITIPLKFLFATRFVQNRVALIGDACHRVHPLAGQGLNLGLGDVDCLQRVLTDSLHLTADIGNVSHLKIYQTERLRKTVPVVTAINLIDQLYNRRGRSDFMPLNILRSLALQLADASQALKQRVISFVS